MVTMKDIQQGTSFVVIHRPLFDDATNVVRSEGVGATAVMTSELIKAGRKRIAFVGLPFSDRISEDRLFGYQTGLREAGIEFDPDLVRPSSSDRGVDGYQIVRDLLNEPNRPDGVVLANSRLAVAGLQAIVDAGLQIPEDIGVAAFHDINALDPYASRLIRAVQPSYKMGQLATKLLLELESNDGAPSQEIVLEPEIFLPGQANHLEISRSGSKN